MIFRTATVDDIRQIQAVRHSVKENKLSDPGLVTDEDCASYLTERGQGWVCEAEDGIVGFAIADLQGHNIWALFLRPEYEGRGIGQALHQLMLDWYFGQTMEPVWLSTAPGTRAERFYKRAGWTVAGMYGKEVKFEMTCNDWNRMK